MLRGASTDRSSFEANRGLTSQEAASSINHKREGLCDLANNERRGLTRDALIEGLNRLNQKKQRAERPAPLLESKRGGFSTREPKSEVRMSFLRGEFCSKPCQNFLRLSQPIIHAHLPEQTLGRFQGFQSLVFLAGIGIKLS